MMNGDFGANALFDKVKRIVGNKEEVQKDRALNFSHRWLEYVIIAQKSIVDSKETSLKSLARLKLRQKVKGVYHRARTIKARVLGK
jgi:hypothetical protein